MKEVDWQKAAAEFEWDGSLREIYVLGATLQDWNKVLEFIRRLSPAATYFEDNVVVTMPHNVEHILEKRNQGIGTRLDFMVSSFLLQSHFYVAPSESDIDFILDPRELKNMDGLKRLVDFMEQLIILTKKRVVLTHEGTKDCRIIEGFAEADQISWMTNTWLAQDKTEK